MTNRPGNESGYRRVEPLDPILAALREQRYQEALDAATTLIDKSDDAFLSVKEDQFIKAHAHLLRADARLGLRQNDDAVLKDERDAAALGLREAAYRVAARLSVMASQHRQTQTLPSDAETYYRMAAELGDHAAMDILSDVILRQQGKDEERTYWSLQAQMALPPDQLRDKVIYAKQAFNDGDIKFLEAVLAKYSLSGGVLNSNILGLPGRSYLATSLNDWLLRRRLNFVMKAFYKEEVSAEDESTTLGSYRTLRKEILHKHIADLYLLVASRTREADPLIISTSRERIASALSPGDEIVVRCGPLTHQATLWSINRNTNTAKILDPFFEFWQAEHNTCISHFEHVDYRYNRKLVQVSLRELKPMLLAVMTIRDQS